MKVFSTRVAAGSLGLDPTTLSRYIAVGKVPTPNMVATGRTTTHLWTEEEIETVRKLLPKIANGRKTRWRRQRSAASSSHSTKTKAQARVPVPQKARKTRKKR